MKYIWIVDTQDDIIDKDYKTAAFIKESVANRYASWCVRSGVETACVYRMPLRNDFKINSGKEIWV